MTTQTSHPLASYLLLAELGAALFGGTPASAEERITLEIIGAVRMSGPETARRVEASPVRTEASEPRETTVERSTDGMATRHN